MSPDQVAEILRMLLREALILAGPVLFVSAVLSLLLSLVQTLTSLQEQSLTAVPRLLAVVMVMSVGMPWFLHRVGNYTISLYADLSRYIR